MSVCIDIKSSNEVRIRELKGGTVIFSDTAGHKPRAIKQSHSVSHTLGSILLCEGMLRHRERKSEREPYSAKKLSL